MHVAEDGWLARVRLPGGRATSAQLLALGEVAATGNGLVDVTRRANVQIRGLARHSGEAAALTLEPVGVLPSVTHELVRNIVANPFGGRQAGASCLTDAVVERLDGQLCADNGLQALPERFLFGVDDGSGILNGLRVDVAAIATARREAAERFRLVIGGAATNLTASPEQTPEMVLSAARAFLTVRDELDSRAWHVAELPGGAPTLAKRLGSKIVDVSADDQLPLLPGLLRQRDGATAVTGLVPLGRLDAVTLVSLADLVPEVRFSPRRTVTVVDVNTDEAPGLLDGMARIGLVTAPGSGWEGLTSCVGTGACTKARVDVRGAAVKRARLRGASAPLEHWSACQRRCGEPGNAGITVATGDRNLLVREPDAETACTDVTDALALLSRRTSQ
ncbi:MAG: precorrin-3B synthase [Acidimicrobiia bacterium]